MRINRLIEEIFRGLHNPDFVDKVMAHMKEDDKGLPNYSVALFGSQGPVLSNSSSPAGTAPHVAMAIRWLAPLWRAYLLWASGRSHIRRETRSSQ